MSDTIVLSLLSVYVHMLRMYIAPYRLVFNDDNAMAEILIVLNFRFFEVPT